MPWIESSWSNNQQGILLEYVKGEANIDNSLFRLVERTDEAYDGINETLYMKSLEIGLNTICNETKAIAINNIAAQQNISSLEANDWPKELRNYQVFASEMHSTKGVLLRGVKIILRKSLCSQAMKITHIGHSGVMTMKRMLRERVWWSRIDEDVNEFARNRLWCSMLAENNSSEPMEWTELPQKSLDFIAIDFYLTKELNSTISIITDYYTRLLKTATVTTNDTTKVTAALEKLIEIYVCP